jgi:hypothetical protein
MRKKYEDLTGCRYGKLSVVGLGEPLVKNTGYTDIRWKCICDCGNSSNTSSTNLRQGKTISCGCVRTEKARLRFIGNCHGEKTKGHKHNRQEPRKVAWKNWFILYCVNAKTRGIEWSLLKEDFITLSTDKCFYCGIEPRENLISYNPYIRNCEKNNTVIDKQYAERKIIFTNGIDRVDNNKGYILGNCVPCCTMCNRSKMDYSKEDFESWILKASDNIRSRRK